MKKKEVIVRVIPWGSLSLHVEKDKVGVLLLGGIPLSLLGVGLWEKVGSGYQDP